MSEASRNVISEAGGNVISETGGNLVSEAGGNLVSEARGNLVSEVGGNLRLAVRAALCAGAATVFATAGPAAAQDEFGRMVAVSGGAVIVGKPGPARGPAALYRFERDRSGAWALAGTFSPPETAENGWRLATSMQWSGGRLVVGSADPDVRIGAHLFQDAQGGLAYEAGLELPRASEPEPPAAGPGGTAVDFAGIMSILQPPARMVAVERERVAVSVAGNGTTPGGVHVFQQGRRGWGFPTILPPPGPESEFPDFGAAMALRRDDVLVSSPRAGEVGQVFVYRPEDDPLGNITISPVDSLEAGARFGAALAVDGGHLLVGAPGARLGSGLVFAYRRFDAGEWELRQVLSPGSPDRPDEQDAAGRSGPADAFGTTLAVLGDELWVGAPLARDGSGEVRRFRLINGRWEPAPLDMPEAGRDAALGSAIAVGTTAAVLGAPGTDGGYGAAMVFTREPGEPWGEPEWLRPGAGPDAVTGGEVLCEEGAAAGFSCEAVDLLAFLPSSAIGAEPWERVSDIWGWADPETGREYALVGRSGGAAIVDVTDPAAPRYVGVVAANPSGARDLKVYADHLFFTGDGAGDHGLVVFDLTRLRDTSGDPASPNGGVVFDADAVYRGIASAHNLVMDAESGFAFPVGSSGGGETCGGGLHMVDVRDPKAPVFAGCFTDDVGLIAPGRTHDAQCVVYRGPDDRYHGRQVCFISNESLLRIVDITEKEAPTPIGGASHPGVAYIHQGWLTEDHRYYYLDDELDELVGTASRTRTYIYDVAELDDPILVGSVDGPTGATDHNLYVKGDRMYQANYQAGFRLFDISDPEAPEEIGWFDTTPYEGDPPGFVGAWTAYPFFESGTVVVTSMYEGVFLLRPRPRQLIP